MTLRIYFLEREALGSYGRARVQAYVRQAWAKTWPRKNPFLYGKTSRIGLPRKRRREERRRSEASAFSKMVFEWCIMLLKES